MELELTDECDPISLLDCEEIELCEWDDALLRLDSELEEDLDPLIDRLLKLDRLDCDEVLDLVTEIEDSELLELFDPLIELLLWQEVELVELLVTDCDELD